jgi:hypothetical protein
MPIPKRESTQVLQSLGAGVVPRIGLQHIAVGRLQEISALKRDLEGVAEGGAALRVLVGRYGCGKSFLLHLVRTVAFDHKFVVADADFTPERKLYATDGQAVATYRELMKNLSTKTMPTGNALPAILERWISELQTSLATEGKPPEPKQVEAKILETTNKMHELVHGYDFGMVIAGYYRGYVEGKEELKQQALRWLRGEFTTKTEAREKLGVRVIIDDENWYDYLKVMGRFVHDIGYSGLLVNLDEGVNLYKITHANSRARNYEKLLSILNDCLQGGAGYVGFLLSGTPEFLEDTRRGLFSYEALKTRLSANRFEKEGVKDFSGPVIKLSTLTNEEVFVLLTKIRGVHAEHYAVQKPLEDPVLQQFMEASLRRLGAKEFQTPRDVVRDFVNLLNLLQQYPDKKWEDLLGKVPPPPPPTSAEATPAPPEQAAPSGAEGPAPSRVEGPEPAQSATPAPAAPTPTSGPENPSDKFKDFRV